MANPGMRLRPGAAGRVRMLAGVMVAMFSAGGAALPVTTGGGDSLSVIFEPADSTTGPWIRRACTKAVGKIETFFGLPYRGEVRVRVFPDRAALTAYWRSSWGMPDLQVECWQVASGTASLLAILSPTRWKAEACDHDPADTAALRLLVAHELVHVFHAQRSTRPEFEGMDEISWLVEGLATYVSGQLDRMHAKAARTAVSAGVDPRVLAGAWSGRYRYGIAGSLVRYIDMTYGRAALRGLLSATSQEEILRVLGVEEGALLAAWRAWVLSEGG